MKPRHVRRPARRSCSGGASPGVPVASADASDGLLASWLRLQQDLLARPEKPSSNDRSTAAWEAFASAAVVVESDDGGGSVVETVAMEPGDNGRNKRLLLEPDEMIELLETAVLCPAFSNELFLPGGPLAGDNVFCSERAFEGDTKRRQFFSNQVSRLYFEKALLVRRALDALEEIRGSEEGEEMCMRAVLVRDPSSEDTAGALRTFLLDSSKAAGLDALSRKGIVLMQPQVAVSGADASAETGAKELPARVAWSIGVVHDIQRGSRVSSLRVLVYPLAESDGRDGRLGTDGGAEAPLAYQCFPVGFLPTVLRRQQDAVRSLCERDKRFSEEVQGLVFGKPRRAAAGEVAAAGASAGAAAAVARADISWDISHTVQGATPLNAQQRAAVEAALGPGPLTLIQGPPGTGKTAVAVAIVAAWLEQDAKTPILVATGTHTTKNMIVSRLQERGYVLSDRRDEVSKPKPKRRNAARAGPVPVFVETVYMVAVPEERGHLPRVLLDESTQITEAAALVALGRGCSRLVLIGDPKQLGPVSGLRYLGLAGGAEPGDGRQLTPYGAEHDSFYELLQQRHCLEPSRLSMQYRMDPRLRSYPSERFYDGALEDGPGAGAASSMLPEGFPLPRAAIERTEGGPHPAVFIDTAELEGRHETLSSCGSAFNRLEAALVVQVLRALADAGVPKHDVFVVTAYAAHRDHLAQVIHPPDREEKEQQQQPHGDSALGNPLLRASRRRVLRSLFATGADLDEEWPHPRVYTVDGIQGGESNFVVFSAVRSNAHGQTGFVGDPRRLCVLLTRAKQGLVVIGDSSTLQNDPEWSEWLSAAPKQRIWPSLERFEA